MNKEFIERLKNSKFLETIKKDREIICIYLGGSRSNGLGTEESDYDLVIITTKEEQEEIPLRLSYEDKSVHWYYRSLHQMVLGVSHQWYTRLFYISAINLYNFEQNLIYVNEKYQSLFDFIIKNKKEIMYYNCWQFVLNNWSFKNIVQQGKITEVSYSKYIYHMLVCYSILFNQPFDKDLLIKLKKIKRIDNANEVLQAEIQKAEKIILFLNEYYNNHQKEVAELGKYLEKEIEKLKEVQ